MESYHYDIRAEDAVERAPSSAAAVDLIKSDDLSPSKTATLVAAGKSSGKRKKETTTGSTEENEILLRAQIDPEVGNAVQASWRERESLMCAFRNLLTL